MKFHRTPTCLLLSAAFMAVSMPASSQISTGTEYRQAVDIDRDSFGEDYAAQKRAAEENNNNSRKISKNVAPYVSKAMKSMQKPDYKKAIVYVNKGLAMPSLTKYEESVLYQLRAAATLKQGNYADAIGNYESAIATGGMTDEEITAVQANISKLRAAAG